MKGDCCEIGIDKAVRTLPACVWARLGLSTWSDTGVTGPVSAMPILHFADILSCSTPCASLLLPKPVSYLEAPLCLGHCCGLGKYFLESS